MNKKIIVLIIIVLIIPIVIYAMNSNQQVSEEPAGFDVQKENDLGNNDQSTTETAVEDNEDNQDNENDESEKENIEYNNNEKEEDAETIDNSDEVSFETNEEENDSTAEDTENNQVEDNIEEESTSEGEISYTTESGLDIEGEIDFDMDLEEKISNEDKIEAIKYAAKLDIPYLLGLIGDGITDDDKVLVAEHLREKLAEEEYNEAKELIVKYLFLLK